MKYVILITKPWGLSIYENLKKEPGEWYMLNDLDEKYIKSINPKYIFFPHWSHKVPDHIISDYRCVCFHETDLPYGRGGSPIQNLIARGHSQTVITALKMTDEIDAGAYYLKAPLSLYGTAEEIFIRASGVITEMIKKIVEKDIILTLQIGEPTWFKRRKPEESEIKTNTLEETFDHIRMLDAETYPKAFIEHGGFRYEFTRASLKTNRIIADVTITKL